MTWNITLSFLPVGLQVPGGAQLQTVGQVQVCFKGLSLGPRLQDMSYLRHFLCKTHGAKPHCTGTLEVYV